MKKYLLYIIILKIGYSQNCAQDVEWCFQTSQMQAFYFFIDVDINDESIESGSVLGPNDQIWECPDNDCDIIGAFHNNVCIGWTYPFYNNGYTIPVMMNDGNYTDYINSGDIPEFRLYDRSSGIIYNGLTPDDIPECNNMGFEIVAYLISDGEWVPNIDYEILLFEGQNLISFFALPDDASVSNVMDPVELNVEGIIGQGVVASHMGNGFWVGSLSEFTRISGYWIKMSIDDTLHVSAKPDINPLVTLYLGNNLISYPIDDTVLIAESIPDNVEDQFKAIIGQGIAAQNAFNNNNQNDELWYGSMSHFRSKSGYWVQIEDDDIDFSTPIPFYFEGSDLYSRVDLVLEEYEHNFDYVQSIEQAFYFIESINGVDIDSDDWILAYNNDQIVGARQWNGEYTDVPAMGHYDNSTDDYCRKGDRPLFYIYDEETDLMSRLYGNVPEWMSNGIYNINLYGSNQIMPEEFLLKSAYPNPFNPITNIEYGLPIDSFVSLTVYDITGREVEQLIHTQQLAGYHRLTWDAEKQSTGLYFIKLTVGEYQQTQKLMLIK